MNNSERNLLLTLLVGYLVFIVLNLFCKKQDIKIDLSKIIWEVLNQRVKKKFLVKYYGVDKTTFRKWIKYFCFEMFPNYDDYLAKRTITLGTAIQIVSMLGLTSSHPVCSKKDIVRVGKGNYRSLKESIEQFPDFYGLSKEVYINLRVFPPGVSERISKHYL